MAPPTLSPKQPTPDIRRELLFSDARMTAWTITSTLDNPFPALILRTDAVAKDEQNLRDRIERKLALLVHYDVVLDGYVDVAEPLVRQDAGGDRDAASYKQFYPKPPHALKKPAADVQAPAMQSWPQLLSSSSNQALQELAPKVEETLNQIALTVGEISELHTQLESMSVTGDKKQLVDAANAARKGLFGKLGELVHARPELHLGSEFPSSFFRRARRWNQKVVTVQSLDEQIEAVESNLENLRDLRNKLLAQAQLEDSVREQAERRAAKAQLAESMKSLEHLQQQIDQLKQKAGEQ